MVMDRIEAVTVCVGYDDFLQEVVPYNLPMFDRWLIVTSAQDEKTREACRRLGLDCLLSEEGYTCGRTEMPEPAAPGTLFKGRLVERGLQQLSAHGWHVHIDADIALPRHFRQMISVADLDRRCVHGADRVMVESYADWQKMKASGYLDGGQHIYGHAVTFPVGYRMGARWASASCGYVPIGFFQMWDVSAEMWRGNRIRPYPWAHNDACRSDVQHGLQWDRVERRLIPEVVAVHLESEPTKIGANWNGRRTQRFGPSPTPGLSAEQIRAGDRPS
jgi:hypothetical protein